MVNNVQLSKKKYAEIDRLSQDGNAFMDDENLEAAIKKWNEALDLLPTPKSDWEAFMWLSASIGDAHFQQKSYTLALASFQDALNAPGGIENPFIHYRLGQCQLALDNLEPAIESLLKSYMLDGGHIFKAEDGGLELLKLLEHKKLIN